MGTSFCYLEVTMPTVSFPVNGTPCRIDFLPGEEDSALSFIKKATQEETTVKKPATKKATAKKPAAKKKKKPAKKKTKRCANCQQPGHLFAQCSSAVACAVCAEEHTAAQCPV